MYPGEIAKTAPDRIAYVMAGSGHSVSYGQLDQRSNQGAHLMRSLGLGPGSAIAICLENHPRFFEIVWAAQRSGLQYTTVSSRLTAPEIEYIVKDCGAQVFITSKAKAEVATELTDSLGQLTARYMLDGTIPGYRAFEAENDAQPTTPVADEMEGVDMLYSSGTTGRPKGVKVKGSGQPIGTPSALLLLMKGLYGADENSVYLSPRCWG